MKKLFSIVLAALTVVSLAVSVCAADFKAASGTPVIDGKLDDAYQAAEEIKINVATSGAGKTSGTARCIWDEKNLYVFFDITDPVLSEKYSAADCYQTDSCEFFIDLSGAAAGSLITEVNAGQYTAHADLAGAPNTYAGGGKHYNANGANATFKTVKTDKGYTIEMQIPFGADFTPKADEKIGVVFHINDDEDGKDGREGEVFAGKDQTAAWKNTSNWDTLTLTAAKYEAPKPEPSSPATADMSLVMAAVSLLAGVATVSLRKKK